MGQLSRLCWINTEICCTALLTLILGETRFEPGIAQSRKSKKYCKYCAKRQSLSKNECFTQYTAFDMLAESTEPLSADFDWISLSYRHQKSVNPQTVKHSWSETAAVDKHLQKQKHPQHLFPWISEEKKQAGDGDHKSIQKSLSRSKSSNSIISD